MSEANVTTCLEYWLQFIEESGITSKVHEVWWNYGDDTDECLCMEYQLDPEGSTGLINRLELCFTPDGMVEYDFGVGFGIGVDEYGYVHISDWYLTTLKRITRRFR